MSFLAVASALLSFLLVILIYLRDSKYIWMLYGFAAIVIGQMLLFLCFFLHKLRSLFSNTNIKVKLTMHRDGPNRSQIRFNTLRSKVIFLNKYSQQAKLARKKLKFAQKKLNENMEFELEAPRVNYFKVTNEFLSRIEQYQNILDKFSRLPLNWSHSLKQLISTPLLGTELRFLIAQENSPSNIQLSDLSDIQNRQYSNKSYMFDHAKQVLWLPSWRSIFHFIKEMSTSYSTYIQEIMQSNASLIEVTYRKILEDKEFLTGQISILTSSIEETKAVLEKLKKQEELNTPNNNDAEIQADNAQDHAQWINWLKKGYREFTNLSLKIKKQETKLKYMIQKLNYYRQNLQIFVNRYKHSFYKSKKTALRAFFQGYGNSVNETLQMFDRLMKVPHNHVQPRPPKVLQIVQSLDLQQSILGQKKYRYEYFQRIDFYLADIRLLEQSIEDMDTFLFKLRKSFLDLQSENQNGIAGFGENVEKFYIKSFKSVTQSLISVEFLEQLNVLINVNQRFHSKNVHQLHYIQSKIVRLKESVTIEVGNLEQNGVRQFSYMNVMSRLEQHYRTLEEQVKLTTNFREIFTIHSNRIKKALLFNMSQMLASHRKVISTFIQAVGGKLFDMQNDLNVNMDDVQYDQAIVEIKSQESQEEQDNSKDITISDTFLNCFNKFLFAACMTWAESQRFKNKIMKKLYVTFNGDTINNFSEIQVCDFQMKSPPFKVSSIRGLRSEKFECLLQIGLSFPGCISFQIATKYNFFKNRIDLKARAEIRGLNCTARICFVPSKIGRGWFSFIGQPILKIDIIPVVGDFKMDYSLIRRLIEDSILDKLRKKIFPIKAPLRVPVSKKSKKSKLVRQRMAKLREQQQK